MLDVTSQQSVVHITSSHLEYGDECRPKFNFVVLFNRGLKWYTAMCQDAPIILQKLQKSVIILCRKRKDCKKPGRRESGETIYLIRKIAVCRKHFNADSLETNLKTRLMPEQKIKRRLKRDSVPCVFFSGPEPKKPRACSEAQGNRRRSEELLQEMRNREVTYITNT